MLINSILRAATVALAATFVAGPGMAQDYPSKEVRWVIPWNAGGSNDIMARYLQPILEEQGVSVVIENLPGGTGAVGMGAVATSRADGYTIGNGTSSTLSIIAQGKAPLSNDDFTNVIRVSVDPLILVVPGDSEIDTLDQFLAHMKDNPGDVTIGTPGTNNLNHIFAAMTARGAGVDYRHVPFPGGSRVIAELMGNQIQAGVLKPSETIEQIQAGELKPLGAFSNERLEILPDIPTFGEAGVDVFPYGPVVQMAYIQAPAGLDPETEKALADAFEAALTSEQFREFADKNGFVIDPLRGDELDAEVAGVAGAIAEVAKQVFAE
ncbi:tripartite tricarboxylate transporter family receptor [Antarctobacter heliothermus]|uniref:Tripartite tricarboxylate transporter family receptor n=1 Tax=Antarctobacter heliothermus TaxID=74033 RepID=A0A222E4W9_9RHOB|nr:tripartite tricarboxylate transporter substrate binding protein [Antarctobacter heliothermus]ASP21246.1 tripartite tricarboxylate transporter family receptor [Antarctobacter heliothermus]